MNNLIKTIFGSSPRTTILGFVKAAFVAMLPIFQKDGFDINKDWAYLVGAALLAISGRVQKDSNGVTRQEAKALVSKDTVQKESIL